MYTAVYICHRCREILTEKVENKKIAKIVRNKLCSQCSQCKSYDAKYEKMDCYYDFKENKIVISINKDNENLINCLNKPKITTEIIFKK